MPPEGMTHRFERQSLIRRGHFSNYFTCNPVQRLVFREDELEITRRWGSTRCRHSDVKAEIFQTYMWKAYGAYSGSYIKQTLVTLRCAGRRFVFDLSGNFADFKERNEILHLISENMEIINKKRSLADVKRSHARTAIVFVGALILLAMIFKYLGI
jgi:hypothetical protein